MRPKRSTVIAAIVIALLALAGTVAYVLVKLDPLAPSLSEQITKVRQAQGSWWLGPTFEGLPITLAHPAGGDRVDDLGYGTCRRFGGKLDPFVSTRCGYPLVLQVRKRRYDLSIGLVPRQLDGTCSRTTVRGMPVAVGQGGSILYTGDLAIAVLGRPEDVGRALELVRPVGGKARLTPPSPRVDALSQCEPAARPFASLDNRIARLRRNPGLPLAWVGEWYAGGRLTTAGRTGSTAVLSYTSCGRGSDLGSCLETMSISSEPILPSAVRDTVSDATCHTFAVGDAAGVAWTKDIPGETGGGVILFTGGAMISLGTELALQSVPMSRFEAIARLTRPLPPARRLPPPRYAAGRLLSGCAQRAPLSPG